MGRNGLWHGGIHFDGHTAAHLDQSGVRCIADGEVIAYRIDARYPHSEYGAGDGGTPAPFSTGFVLVRHRLQAPAIGEDRPPALTLYSLYMHLQDWMGYQAEGAAAPPPFLGEALYRIRADKAYDPIRGLRVRAGRKGTAEHATILALLPKGCRVRLGEADRERPQWRKLIALLEGRALPDLPAGGEGWVFGGELQDTDDPDVFLVGERANDIETGLAPGKGLNLRRDGSGERDDPITAMLPEGAVFTLGAGSGAYRPLGTVVEGGDLAPPGSDGLHGHVHFASLEPAGSSTPTLDRVQVLERPWPIKAGEPIGHLGLYRDHDGSAQPRLHLEVFSCDDVPAFVRRSRAWAARLPDTEKTLLKVHRGASKLIPHRAGIDADHPPRPGDAGVTVGVDLILPQRLLDSLPAERRLRAGSAAAGSVSHWWRLDNLLADADGKPIDGWLAEQELITTRHSPWEWEGFDFIEETGRPLGELAHRLDADGRLSDEENPNYQAQIDLADQGPIRSRLHDLIDGDGDGKLAPHEIAAALRKPWVVQSLAQLITRHESEWFWNPGKWDELDPLMEHSPETRNPNWESEKRRIEKLAWWGELAGRYGIGTDGMGWHFHPVAVISSTTVDIREARIRAFLRMIRVGEGTVGNSGYEKLFGGSSFIKDHGKTFDDHPQIKVKKSGYNSSAAGAYQVMGYTWADNKMLNVRRRLEIKDFTPESQDKFCVALLKYKVRGKTLDAIMNGNSQEAIENSSWEWASLPPGRYGQPIESMSQALSSYEKFLKEELSGSSDLHLKPGFLREFSDT
ncbi:glycoside hydrolase family 104 protein [Azotobacter chroococcum]|uniref:Glycoside hydrolase family 104 protein n=1 Tax=Azotobacter chroococcum TaxID=353 RepID=A0AA43Z6I2_9GAMM|nr:glycoside hydrolase family 104 protein [Azotobacter chroococcum]NHN77131.1 glycoside hydrolase family 104 protein [Azotobacter chroococcum]